MITKKRYKAQLQNAKHGASYLMVKPGITSIDSIKEIKNKTKLPTGAYQVKGICIFAVFISK